MGTAVTGFMAGVMAGALLVACGGGGDAPRTGNAARAVLVCGGEDEACQRVAVLDADRVCKLMPSGHLLYLGAIGDAELRANLEERGYWLRTGNEWIEGDDCD